MSTPIDRDALIEQMAGKAAAALAARGYALDAEYAELTGEYVESTDYSETAAVATTAALPVVVAAVTDVVREGAQRNRLRYHVGEGVPIDTLLRLLDAIDEAAGVTP